jgi:hypothetical protein
MPSLRESDNFEILKMFPKVELCYESIVYNKVYQSDMIMAIPRGIKYFYWFTVFKSENVCILLEINDSKQFSNIEIVYTNSTKDNNHLHCDNGTILYGTIIHNNSCKYFCIEDIYYYLGKNVSLSSIVNKMHIFEEVLANKITHTNYIFGLPIMSMQYEQIMYLIKNIPYVISHIQFYKENNNGHREKMNLEVNETNQVNNKYQSNKPQLKKQNKNNREYQVVFKVKADLQNDIYHLYCSDDNDAEYATAFIPNYKTSVMMNKIFRNIKENDNLDALEESDDEDDFENTKIDKFVFLDKIVNMVCIKYKHNKWVPINIAPQDKKVVAKSHLHTL